MPTLREYLLPVFDNVARRLMEDLGLRTSELSIITRTWTGRPGASGATSDDGTPLVIDPAPKVREVSGREIAGSGGRYSDGDVRVTKITPAYAVSGGGGYTVAQLVPTTTSSQEIIYRLVGPLAGDYALVDSDLSRNFGYELTLRRKR